MPKSNLGIIIPSYNEHKNLIKLCFELKNQKNTIIIDDGSNDNTNFFLKKKKINHITNYKNLGYEKSILNGFQYFLKKKNIKYILTMDADGQHNPKYIKKFYKIIKNKNYDLVIGNRNKFNRLTEYFLSFLFKGIRDPICGFKMYKKEFIKKNYKFFSDKYFLIDILFFLKENNFYNKNIVIRKRLDESKFNFFKINHKIISIIIIFFFKKIFKFIKF